MSLSSSSIEKLSQCHQDLQELFNKVSEVYPCQVVVGFRDKAYQDLAFSQGRSKDPWPTSKHNQQPSLAVDVCPLQSDGSINWNDTKKFYHFAGYVQGIAHILGINIRWGGNWNRDFNLEQKFNDLDHFELVQE